MTKGIPKGLVSVWRAAGTLDFNLSLIMQARTNIKPEEYVQGILAGNRNLLAQAITLIESIHPKDRESADEVLRFCLPKSGNSIRIGITGPPGVGKSTFIECYGQFLIEEHKRNVAVLAIDPSSTQGKGSILGDKTRMAKLASHPQAFVRPSPSSGSMGGVAFRTRETMILCEAAGYDLILIETLGVGQAQFAVHSMVDFLLLLTLTGSGDSLQGIKRGIMEMADMVLINKADGENRPAAQAARQQHQAALSFHRRKESGWRPRAETCSALEKEGLTEVWTLIEEYVRQTQKNKYFMQNRKKQSLSWLREKLQERMSFLIEQITSMVDEEAIDWQEKILSGQITVTQLAQRLLEEYKS